MDKQGLSVVCGEDAIPDLSDYAIQSPYSNVRSWVDERFNRLGRLIDIVLQGEKNIKTGQLPPLGFSALSLREEEYDTAFAQVRQLMYLLDDEDIASERIGEIWAQQEVGLLRQLLLIHPQCPLGCHIRAAYTDENRNVRYEGAQLVPNTVQLLMPLAVSSDETVKSAIAQRGCSLPLSIQMALVKTAADDTIFDFVHSKYKIHNITVLSAALERSDEGVIAQVADLISKKRLRLPIALLEELAHSGRPDKQLIAAENSATPLSLLTYLLDQKISSITKSISKRTDLPEHFRVLAAI